MRDASTRRENTRVARRDARENTRVANETLKRENTATLFFAFASTQKCECRRFLPQAGFHYT